MRTSAMAAAGIGIRAATTADVPRIAALIAMGSATRPLDAAAAELEGGHPAYAAAFERLAASPGHSLFVTEAGGQVVGTFQVSLLPGIAERGRLRAKLESVHVAPGWRGRGLGRLMVAHAIAHARAAGAGLMELSSNKNRLDAHRFYRGLGFAQSHEGFKLVLDPG